MADQNKISAWQAEIDLLADGIAAFETAAGNYDRAIQSGATMTISSLADRLNASKLAETWVRRMASLEALVAEESKR